MISTLFKSFKLTIAFSLLFSICYIFVLWIFAQVAGPNKGNAEVLELDGKVVGAANVGQNFTEDIYFWDAPLVRATATTLLLPPEATKALPTKNTFRKSRRASTPSSFIIPT